MLAGEHAGPQELARFRSEAAALARLQHPNIVQIHEVGEHEGRPYFSMEFVDGGSLAQRPGGAPLPAREAARLVRTLAGAVHAAHQKGVVHRDLKPANVLLGSDGTPKVTDFGLAKRLDGPGGSTQSGAILGTPSYMAPEQAAGRGKQIGPAADVYALGAILYELLTGRPPFRAATAVETLVLVQAEEPVPPSRLQPGVPRDLETVCLKCLHKEPARRHGGAAALADDLGRWLAGEPILARRVGAWERAVKWVRRRPAAATLVGVSAVSAAALVIGLAVSNTLISQEQWRTKSALEGQRAANEQLSGALVKLRSEQQRTQDALVEAQTARAHEEEKRQEVEKLLREAQVNLYADRLAEVDRELLSGNVERANHILATCAAERRNWEWRHLRWRCETRREVPTLRGFRGYVYNMAFSPDGRLLAAACGDHWYHVEAPGCVKVWEVATGKELHSFQGFGVFFAVAFSPDGKLLAAGGADKEPKNRMGLSGGTTVWDLATGAEARTIRGPRVFSLAFAEGGDDLVIGDRAGVGVWSIAQGIERRRFDARAFQGGSNSGLHRLAFSPDRRRLAAGAFVWDFATGGHLLTLPKQVNRYGLCFSPDGKQLATSCGGYENQLGAIKVYEAAGGKETLALQGGSTDVFCVVFSPDGQRLVSAGGQWNETMTLRSTFQARQPADVAVWDLATGKRVFTLRGHNGAVHSVAFSPDGKTLASGGTDAVIRLWKGT